MRYEPTSRYPRDERKHTERVTSRGNIVGAVNPIRTAIVKSHGGFILLREKPPQSGRICFRVDRSTQGDPGDITEKGR